MMEIKLRTSLVIIALLLPVSALAQAQAPLTVEQRLAMQIATLSLQNAHLAEQVEKEAADNAALQKQIADAKAKPEESKNQ